MSDHSYRPHLLELSLSCTRIGNIDYDFLLLKVKIDWLTSHVKFGRYMDQLSIKVIGKNPAPGLPKFHHPLLISYQRQKTIFLLRSDYYKTGEGGLDTGQKHWHKDVDFKLRGRLNGSGDSKQIKIDFRRVEGADYRYYAPDSNVRAWAMRSAGNLTFNEDCQMWDCIEKMENYSKNNRGIHDINWGFN